MLASEFREKKSVELRAEPEASSYRRWLIFLDAHFPIADFSLGSTHMEDNSKADWIPWA